MTTTITAADGTTASATSSDYGYQHTPRTIVHDVLGREDPDVTLRPVGLRNGTLTLQCAPDQVDAVLTVLRRPLVLTLTDDELDHLDMAFVVQSTVGVQYQAEYKWWTVTAGFQEVAA